VLWPLRRGDGAPPSPESPWRHAGPEPSLDEALADPIVRLVLARDGLAAEDVGAAMRLAAARLRARDCPAPDTREATGREEAARPGGTPSPLPA
jgi:hypothetical protein